MIIHNNFVDRYLLFNFQTCKKLRIENDSFLFIKKYNAVRLYNR
jgi:hypothetical protein